MIEFVICDDNKEFTIFLRRSIKKFMQENTKMECNFNTFAGYGDEFEAIVKNSLSFKVYFLDIETKKGSGLDAARLIREKYDDWNSIIIIVTSHEEFRYEALGDRLFLFDFINKLNNLEKNLNTDLANILKLYNSGKTLTVEFDHRVCKISLNDIIYIEKLSDTKKCVIGTTYGNREVQMSLHAIYNQLDDNFIKASRSLIVNIKKVRGYDSKSNEVEFVNGYSSTLVSREYKKELMDRVKNID